MTARGRRWGTGAAGLLLVALSACSSGEPSTGPPDPTTRGSSTEATTSASADPTEKPTPAAPTEPAPYLPVPDGVELTAQGSDLRFGDRATVAWEPRREVVGAVAVTVTGVRRTTLKDFAAFRLDPTQRRSTPYFVRATVKNVGRTNLAGVSVPLYAVNAADTLIQSTPFAATFKPCPSTPFPKPFATGDRAQVCLVYLVPQQGTLASVSFRPTQEYDPITWTGKIVRPPTKR